MARLAYMTVSCVMVIPSVEMPLMNGLVVSAPESLDTRPQAPSLMLHLNALTDTRGDKYVPFPAMERMTCARGWRMR